ncbi:MAG: hypothetical protein ACKV1O_30995 [Saprospiraceae bacterium]
MPTKTTTTVVKRRRTSPALTAYRTLVKTKSKLCKGSKTKTDVKAAAARYKAAAVKAGKDVKVVEKTVARVLNSGCSMTSAVAGKLKKRTAGTTVARKRKVAARKRA